MKVPVLDTGRPSFWRDRDPRVKWLLFFLFLALIYLAPSWEWMLGAVGIGLLVALTARAPLGWLALMLALHVPTIIALVVIPMLGADFAFDAKFAFGLRMALGWVAAILIGVGLFSTMDIDQLVDGLRGLGLPAQFAFVVGYAFVLIYLSLSDLAQVTDSMRLKGIALSPRRPVQLLWNMPKLVIPAMLTVMRRGGAMTAALETRGFAARERVIAVNRLDRWDFIIVLLAVGTVLVAFVERLRIL